jgi:hypothetical protein
MVLSEIVVIYVMRRRQKCSGKSLIIFAHALCRR